MLEVRMYINVSLSIARFDCQGATTVEGGNPKGPTSVISTAVKPSRDWFYHPHPLKTGWNWL